MPNPISPAGRRRMPPPLLSLGGSRSEQTPEQYADSVANMMCTREYAGYDPHGNRIGNWQGEIPPRPEGVPDRAVWVPRPGWWEDPGHLCGRMYDQTGRVVAEK